jgi:NAD(P)-dependent dehydrogenase (short-subunit alcohol dehydrogenase family)
MTLIDKFDLGLKGRVALVTGAASGIGRATALRLADVGARVVLADINEAGAKEVASSIGDGAIALRCDLGSAQSCEAVVVETVERCGRLDILINCGAMMVRQTLDAATAEDVERMSAANMGGSLFIARAAISQMKKTGYGRVILFSSVGAFTGGHAGATIYSMTKAGVLALVKSLTREFASTGITINAVAPGMVDTPMLRNDVSDEALQSLQGLVPAGRVAAPKELANACLFLASEWASYVTGHTLDVNGGLVMR